MILRECDKPGQAQAEAYQCAGYVFVRASVA